MKRHVKRQRGNVLIEFALVVWLVIAPLFFGLVWGGLTLGRTLQATQVNRDAGHMYAKNIDFTLKKNQQLLERLAIGMNLDRNGGGDGVIIFSQIMHVDPASPGCAGPPLCANADLNVFIHRVVVGNSGLRASNYGTPGTVTADGSVPNYMTDTAARANYSDMTLLPGEKAFVTETFFQAPDLIATGAPGMYSRITF